MNKELENFNRLFSEDDAVVLNAIKEKKDWILHSFYLVMSLADNKDVEDLFEKRIRFRKLALNPYGFDKEALETLQKEIDQKYRVCYFWDELPEVDDEHEFIVKVNFNRLSQSQYQQLFANFYPCINIFDLNHKIDDIGPLNLFPFMMDKGLGDEVIILENHALIESCFSCDVFETLILPKNLLWGYRPSLYRLADALHLQIEDKAK